MVVTENGRIRWWRPNEEFDGFWLDARSEVSPNTAAGSFLNGELLPEEAEEVDGETWLELRAG
jgi:hypothetical protein